MRARLWRNRLCQTSMYPPIEFQSSPFDEQICLDLNRLVDPWFKEHKDVLRKILNTFSAVNEGFGYPQGLNFLVCPLYYVYYNEDPKMAVQHTFYSLHGLVHIVLPLYPLHSKDEEAMKTLQAVANVVCLQCYSLDSNMDILFSDSHEPFMTGLVCNMVPTLYSNIFNLQDTLLLWDMIFKQKTINKMFEFSLQILSKVIMYHKNMFLHLPVDKCMQVFQETMKHSISICL